MVTHSANAALTHTLSGAQQPPHANKTMLGLMNSVSVLTLFRAAKASSSQSFRERNGLGVDDFHTGIAQQHKFNLYMDRFSSYCASDCPGWRN